MNWCLVFAVVKDGWEVSIWEHVDRDSDVRALAETGVSEDRPVVTVAMNDYGGRGGF